VLPPVDKSGKYQITTSKKSQGFLPPSETEAEKNVYHIRALTEHKFTARDGLSLSLVQEISKGSIKISIQKITGMAGLLQEIS
jgi:hypothetical protein